MSEHQSHNPWLSIWRHPRATIRHIVAENPNRSLWLLAAIYGFSSILNLFQSASMGTAANTFILFVLAVVFAPLWGYVAFSVWGAVVLWTGKLFKGHASFTHIRAAYAWSCVPFAVNVVLWLLMMVVFGRELFLNFPDEHLLTPILISILFCLLILKIVLSVWSLVIYFSALAEVQQFSILRAIGNVVVAAVVIGVVLAILWSISIYLLGTPVYKSVTTFQFWDVSTQLEYLRRGI